MKRLWKKIESAPPIPLIRYMWRQGNNGYTKTLRSKFLIFSKNFHRTHTYLMLVFGVPRIFFLSATVKNLTNGVCIRHNLVIQRRKKVDFHDFFSQKPFGQFLSFSQNRCLASRSYSQIVFIRGWEIFFFDRSFYSYRTKMRMHSWLGKTVSKYWNARKIWRYSLSGLWVRTSLQWGPALLRSAGHWPQKAWLWDC